MRDLLMFAGSLVLGLGLIAIGFKERAPKCAFCQKKMKKLSPRTSETTKHTHCCGNSDCEYYGNLF